MGEGPSGAQQRFGAKAGAARLSLYVAPPTRRPALPHTPGGLLTLPLSPAAHPGPRPNEGACLYPSAFDNGQGSCGQLSYNMWLLDTCALYPIPSNPIQSCSKMASIGLLVINEAHHHCQRCTYRFLTHPILSTSHSVLSYHN